MRVLHRILSPCLTAAAAVVMVAVLPSSTKAAERCIGEPFSATVQTTEFVRDADRARIGWQAVGTSSATCPSGVFALDVWEHAAVVAVGARGGIKLSGDADLRVFVANSGQDTITVISSIKGRGSCTNGVCTVDADVQGVGAGVRVRMPQRITIDIDSGAVTSVEVLQIVIDFTSAG